jgi:hypothetical protein
MAQVTIPDSLVTAGKALLALVLAVALLVGLTFAVAGASRILDHVLQPHPAPAPPAPTPPAPVPPAPPAPTPKPFPSTSSVTGGHSHG